MNTPFSCSIAVQTPWALPYSTWYHQYPGFPREALKAAAKLSEYTLTDRGTWLSSPSSVTHGLEIYKAGTDHANDPLLLPAHVLLSGTARAHTNICQSFMQWVVSKNGGQQVVEEFKIHRQIVYSPAP
jgi:ABC-type tungstate transport system permease subunit